MRRRIGLGKMSIHFLIQFSSVTAFKTWYRVSVRNKQSSARLAVTTLEPKSHEILRNKQEQNMSH